MAEETIMKTLDEARKRLTEAERLAPGPNATAITEIIRVVRAHNTVLRHLARAQEQADATAAIFDGLDAGEADKS